MKCPFCGSKESQVLESRMADEGVALRRRRQCQKCGKRFTTQERLHTAPLWIVKKDGKREPFDREKIRRGIFRAIRKRPISLDFVEDIVSSIEREMFKKGKREIPSRVVGSAVLRTLKRVDKVAWLRFASVYLEFEDLSDFEKAIERG